MSGYPGNELKEIAHAAQKERDLGPSRYDARERFARAFTIDRCLALMEENERLRGKASINIWRPRALIAEARLAEAEELLRDCRDLNTTGLRRRIERFLDREERYGSPKRTVTNRSGFPETGTEADSG